MHIDPSASNIIGMLVVVLGVGIAMRFLRQPNPVAYILAGLALGPFALGMVTETKLIERLGSYGVIFLLFFVGMEVSLKRISANWKIAFVGTGIQIVLSVAAILAFGHFWGWTIQRSVLMGFILSLSSTAMVIRLLIDRNEMQSRTGDDVLSILIVQDLAIIPMLVVAGYLSDHSPTLPGLAKQSMGGVLFIGLLAFVHRYGHMSNKILRWLKGDKELQLFGALFFSLGLAYVGSLFDLSSALGAFVAGIMITSIKEVEWFHHDLGGFRVIFVAMFFASVGLVLDLGFMAQNWQIAFTLVVLVFALNTIINAGILKFLGRNWGESLRGGALLSQIGEFSFVFAAIGVQANVMTEYVYKMTILIIALTMFLTPFWVAFVEKAYFVSEGRLRAAS